MNIKRTLLSLVTGTTAAALLAASVSAYDLDTDFMTGWSASVTVPGSEFEDATENSVITITYTADASLADMPGHDYWVIKPMINDAGWPFVEGIEELTLSEGKDTYVLSTDETEIKFTLPAAELEHIKTAGLAFMGHGVAVGTLTVSNDETITSAPETTTEEAPATGEIDAATDDDKSSPDTGIADVVAVAGLALVAGGALLVARKRK